MLEFVMYQHRARETMEGHWTPERAALGLCEEAGEIAGLYKRVMRGDFDAEEADQRVIDELGDLLWYMSALADSIGVSLEVIANRNITKLQKRKLRGTIKGEGDDR